MTYNAELTQRVRQALLHIPNTLEKRMFRGVTFMVDGKMCLSTGDNELLIRINPTLHDQFAKKSGCRTMTMKGKEYKGYIFVNEKELKTEKDLLGWVTLALEFCRKKNSVQKSQKR